MSIKRLPAVKTRIKEIVNGKFCPGSKEDLSPSYVITPFGEKISRVNIIATVTEKFINENEDYGTIMLDDSSENIRAKFFREDVRSIKNIEKGDLVLVIGKLKEYNGEVYINAELVRKIENKNEENLRRLEVLKKLIAQKIMSSDIRTLAETSSEEEVVEYAKEKYNIDKESVQYIIQNKIQDVDYKPKFLEIISKMDKGDGVEIGKLFEVMNLPQEVIERTINELLSTGELYEPSIGKLRRVE